MPRRITVGDWLSGVGASLRNGSIGNPLATQKYVNQAHDRRKQAELAEKDSHFGAGEKFGDDNWTPPVHATREDGRPVTISFGRGQKNRGHVLVSDGHVTRAQFYGDKTLKLEKGHDHFRFDGSVASRTDREKSSE